MFGLVLSTVCHRHFVSYSAVCQLLSELKASATAMLIVITVVTTNTGWQRDRSIENRIRKTLPASLPLGWSPSYVGAVDHRCWYCCFQHESSVVEAVCTYIRTSIYAYVSPKLTKHSSRLGRLWEVNNRHTAQTYRGYRPWYPADNNNGAPQTVNMIRIKRDNSGFHFIWISHEKAVVIC